MKKEEKKLDNLKDQAVDAQKVSGGKKQTYFDQLFKRKMEPQSREDLKK